MALEKKESPFFNTLVHLMQLLPHSWVSLWPPNLADYAGDMVTKQHDWQLWLVTGWVHCGTALVG